MVTLITCERSCRWHVRLAIDCGGTTGNTLFFVSNLLPYQFCSISNTGNWTTISTLISTVGLQSIANRIDRLECHFLIPYHLPVNDIVFDVPSYYSKRFFTGHIFADFSSLDEQFWMLQVFMDYSHKWDTVRWVKWPADAQWRTFPGSRCTGTACPRTPEPVSRPNFWKYAPGGIFSERSIMISIKPR